MSRRFGVLVAALALVLLGVEPARGAEPEKTEGSKAAPVYENRFGAAKTQLLREVGGNAASERAVALGLAWLAKQQKEDGSWSFSGSKDKKLAATGFALLPFLGAGQTHRDEKALYKDVVKKGLDWLIKNRSSLEPKEVLGGDGGMYEQAIAALAICESYGMTKDKYLKPAAQEAVDFIQKAQGKNGSWGYTPGTDGDTSLVGWQVQALVAAKRAGDLVVDDRVIKKTIRFLDLASAGERKAMYGYADNTYAKPGTALTASGLLSRYSIDGWRSDHPGMVEGVAGLMKMPPDGDRIKDLYYFYYATQVVRLHEGDEWKTWNEGPKGAGGTRKGGMRDLLVQAQIKRAGTELGSWDPETGYIGTQCGRLGTTALCVLTLEVYYRQVPAPKGPENK